MEGSQEIKAQKKKCVEWSRPKPKPRAAEVHPGLTHMSSQVSLRVSNLSIEEETCSLWSGCISFSDNKNNKTFTNPYWGIVGTTSADFSHHPFAILELLKRFSP